MSSSAGAATTSSGAFSTSPAFDAGTPFKRGGQVVVRLTKESPRDRRLVDAPDPRQPGEEERLLKSAGPHLRDLIIAGIGTGCRVGELLALQWKDVRVDDWSAGTDARNPSCSRPGRRRRTPRVRCRSAHASRPCSTCGDTRQTARGSVRMPTSSATKSASASGRSRRPGRPPS